MFRQLIILFIFFLITDLKSVQNTTLIYDLMLKSNGNQTIENDTTLAIFDEIFLSTNLMPISTLSSLPSQPIIVSGSTKEIPINTSISNEMPWSAAMENTCLAAYNSCFSQWSAKIYNESSIALFCDYSFYEGNTCMNEKTANITFKPSDDSKPFYSFLECSRMISKNNSNVKSLQQLSWNFLSYCISNSPTNTSNPECFKHVKQNCSNPLSSKCTTVCINYIFDEADYSYYESDDSDSSSSKIMFSTLTLLITFLF
uniref:Transmembrane protein n=1 Tax=Panagrolaimus superbus TaxID=310955 RepID=A0A914YJD0_9BILA